MILGGGFQLTMMQKRLKAGARPGQCLCLSWLLVGTGNQGTSVASQDVPHQPVCCTLFLLTREGWRSCFPGLEEQPGPCCTFGSVGHTCEPSRETVQGPWGWAPSEPGVAGALLSLEARAPRAGAPQAGEAGRVPCMERDAPRLL